MFSAPIISAIRLAIDLHYPFAAVALPGEKHFDFYAPLKGDTTDNSDSCDKFEGIEIGPFDAKAFPKTQKICHLYEPEEFLHDFCDFSPLCDSPISLSIKSTPKRQYELQAQNIIKKLRRQEGKVVLSTVVSEYSKIHPIQVIHDYFRKMPDTFRFVFFSQYTGLWFGASPELLLDWYKSQRKIHTMSLAGTRSISKDGINVWDDKNIREHKFVTDFILDTLSNWRFDSRIVDSTLLRFGDIEHLCDHIEADIPNDTNVNPINIIKTLSPTPALCGYPRDFAFEMIKSNESHDRNFYGGWIAMSTPSRVVAYVNLRSAIVKKIDNETWLYNLYVGGGLTSDSIVDEEWTETRRKAAVLHNLIKGVII